MKHTTCSQLQCRAQVAITCVCNRQSGELCTVLDYTYINGRSEGLCVYAYMCVCVEGGRG